MPNIHESEVLQIDEWEYPTAVSYDPGAFSPETVMTILKNQITSPTPLEIHCYVKGAYNIGGIFKTIEASQFEEAKTQTEEQRQKFIEQSTTLIKSINTYDIIFSEPLKRK